MLPQPLPSVVVVGLDCITGLQTARIFARRGIEVIGIAGSLRHQCSSTRACKTKYEADIKSPALADFLAGLGPGFPDRPVLIPCTDLSVLTVSDARARLAEFYRFALPDTGTVKALVDKTGFHPIAERAGLRLPRGWIISSPDDFEDAVRTARFPCFLKPYLKTELWESKTKAKVFRLENKEELQGVFERCRSWTPSLVLQEAIEGGDSNHYTCNCYFDQQGVPQVTFVSRKIRQWPPQVGTGSASVEYRNDEVLDLTLRFFKEAGLKGLGYLELKQDDRDGQYYLIEPNIGRPTGRSALAEASGVEFLQTLYNDLVGLDLPRNRVQTYGGTKWVYWRQDLRASWHLIRKGKLSVPAWWKSIRGRRTCPLLSLQDPMPFVQDLLHLFKVTFKLTAADERY